MLLLSIFGHHTHQSAHTSQTYFGNYSLLPQNMNLLLILLISQVEITHLLTPFLVSRWPNSAFSHPSRSTPHADPNGSLEHLKVELNALQSSAIAPSTLRTYLVGQASYARFCQSLNLCPFPLLESTLRLFVTFLARSPFRRRCSKYAITKFSS